MVVDPASLDEFLAAVERMEEITRTEDGCLYYAMALDDAATGQITILERWRDEAALRVHLATDHVKKFVEQITPMLISMEGALYDAVNERPVMA